MIMGRREERKIIPTILFSREVLEEISATEDLSRSASGGQLLVGVSGRAGVPFRVPAWAVCG